MHNPINTQDDYLKFKSRCNVASWFDIPTLNELNENNIKIVHEDIYEERYLHELENITRQFLKNITSIYSLHVMNGLATNHVIHIIKAL